MSVLRLRTNPSSLIIVEKVSSDDEYLAIKEHYNRCYYDPEDALSMYVSLRNYSEQKQPFIRKLTDNVCEMSSKIEEQERERLKNVTGVLTRSSAGFESVCCKEFSEKMCTGESVRRD